MQFDVTICIKFLMFLTASIFLSRSLAKTKVAKRFLAGIQQWQQSTCIKFVPRANHRDWVQIFRERNPLSRRYVTLNELFLYTEFEFIMASSVSLFGERNYLTDYCPIDR